MCPAQQEEAPWETSADSGEGGRDAQPLKGAHTQFWESREEVEEPEEGEKKMGNWEKLPRLPSLPPTPGSDALQVHKHRKLFEGGSNTEYEMGTIWATSLDSLCDGFPGELSFFIS